MSRILLASILFISCGGTIAADAGIDSAADATDGGAVDSGKDSAEALDASNEATADAADGGFYLGSVPGLVFWLDAAKGVTKNNQNQVSRWADQSGKMNNAVQSKASRQPVHNVSGINGRPTLHFAQGATEGMQLVITDSASLQWGTGDFLLEVVGRFDNDPAGNFDTGIGMFVFKPGALQGIIFAGNRTPGGNLPASAGLMARIDMNVPGNGNHVDVGASYNDSAPRNYAFRRRGTTLDLSVGGASVASRTEVGNIDVSAAFINVYVGSNDTATKFRLDGDIAELIAVKGTTSASDLAAIEAYLKGKYNL